MNFAGTMARITHAICEPATAAELAARGALQPQECGETAAAAAAHLAATRAKGNAAWPWSQDLEGNIVQCFPPNVSRDAGVGSRCGICGEIIVADILRSFVPMEAA